MELWDAYFADGTPANCDLVRGEPIPEGLFHIVCQVLVRHTDGDYLLMQRDLQKPNWPGFWEATAGGSVLKGETVQDCALRELSEETGLAVLSLEKIGQTRTSNAIHVSFLGITDCAKDAVTLQHGETIAYKWLIETEFIDFVNSDRMIPTQKERYRDYLTQRGYFHE